jgi:hypothetical protein
MFFSVVKSLIIYWYENVPNKAVERNERHIWCRICVPRMWHDFLDNWAKVSKRAVFVAPRLRYPTRLLILLEMLKLSQKWGWRTIFQVNTWKILRKERAACVSKEVVHCWNRHDFGDGDDTVINLWLLKRNTLLLRKLYDRVQQIDTRLFRRCYGNSDKRRIFIARKESDTEVMMNLLL